MPRHSKPHANPPQSAKPRQMAVPAQQAAAVQRDLSESGWRHPVADTATATVAVGRPMPAALA